MFDTNIISLKDSTDINIHSIYDENKLYKIYENNKHQWLEIIQRLYKICGFSTILKIYNQVNNSVYIPTELEIENDCEMDCEKIRIDSSANSSQYNIEISFRNHHKNNLTKKHFWNLVCGSIAENFDKIQERDFIEKFSSFLLNSFNNLEGNMNNLLSFSTNYEIFLNLKFISKIIMKNKKVHVPQASLYKNSKNKNKSFSNKSNTNVVYNTIITANTIKDSKVETKDFVKDKTDKINNSSNKTCSLAAGNCRFNNKENIFNYFVKLLKLTKNVDSVIYLNCINILMCNFIKNNINISYIKNISDEEILEFKKLLKENIDFYLKVANFKKIPSTHTFIYESSFKDFLCGFAFVIDFNDEEERRKLYLNYEKFVNNTFNNLPNENKTEEKNKKSMALTASNTIKKMNKILKFDKNNERLWNLVFENSKKTKISKNDEVVCFMEMNDISYEVDLRGMDEHLIIGDYNYIGFSNKVFSLVKSFCSEVDKFSLKKKVKETFSPKTENVQKTEEKVEKVIGKMENAPVIPVKTWADHFTRKFSEHFIVYQNVSEIEELKKFDKVFESSYGKRVENYQKTIQKLINENKNTISFLESKMDSVYELSDLFDEVIDLKNLEIKKINEGIEEKIEMENKGKLWKNKGLGTIDISGKSETHPFGSKNYSNGSNRTSSGLKSGNRLQNENNSTTTASSEIPAPSAISPFGIRSGLAKEVLDQFNVPVNPPSILSGLSNYKRPSVDIPAYSSTNQFEISDELLAASLSSANDYTQKVNSSLSNGNNRWGGKKLNENAGLLQSDAAEHYSALAASISTVDISSTASCNSDSRHLHQAPNPFISGKNANSAFSSNKTSAKNVSAKNPFNDSKNQNANSNQFVGNDVIDKLYNEFTSDKNTGLNNNTFNMNINAFNTKGFDTSSIDISGFNNSTAKKNYRKGKNDNSIEDLRNKFANKTTKK